MHSAPAFFVYQKPTPLCSVSPAVDKVPFTIYVVFFFHLVTIPFFTYFFPLQLFKKKKKKKKKKLPSPFRGILLSSVFSPHPGAPVMHQGTLSLRRLLYFKSKYIFCFSFYDCDKSEPFRCLSGSVTTLAWGVERGRTQFVLSFQKVWGTFSAPCYTFYSVEQIVYEIISFFFYG